MKADWFVSVGSPSAVAEVDPFESPSSPAVMFGETPAWALRVGLETPIPELRSKLVGLIRREARLSEAGMTCPLKDACDTTCSACPFSKANDETSEKSALCRIGIDQERLSTLLVAQTTQGVGV